MSHPAGLGRTAPNRGSTWLGRRPLRTRLLASMLLLLTLACLAVGLATTLALRGFLLNRLDQQLRAAGSRYAVSLEYGATAPSGPGDTAAAGTPRRDADAVPNDGDAQIPAGGFGQVAGQAVGTLGGRVVDGQLAQAGVVTDDGARPLITAADARKLAALRPARDPHSVHLDVLGNYRVLTDSGRDGDVLLTGLPAAGVNDAVERLAVVELVVFTATLLATGLAGAVLVRLSLRPLHQVTSTAQRVAALPLASGDVALRDRALPRDSGTEVGQLGAAFDHMLDHVETALTQREATENRLRQFIADASHELRTPLAAIRSHTELALRTPEPLPGQVDQIGRAHV